MVESLMIDESICGPYLLILTGGVELERVGPFGNDDQRDDEAKRLWNHELNQGEDNVFGMDIYSDKSPNVWAFGDLNEYCEGEDE